MTRKMGLLIVDGVSNSIHLGKRCNQEFSAGSESALENNPMAWQPGRDIRRLEVSKEKEKEILDDIQSIGDKLPEVEEAAEQASETEGTGVSMEQELADAQAEAAAQKDQMMRVAAEFENYKKRMMREKTMAMKYAGEPIFREVLATVDNLERAVAQGKIEGVDAEKGLLTLIEGVELTLKSLLTTLSKFEVTPLESVGDPFDPTNHEALTMEPSDTVPANHVLTEFEKGYQYKDRLLRAAKVIVSAGDKK